ncbi:hypothetical protein LTR78_000376 [Recurvomyces mirabilis]|uniref:Uncharacterized protein n=1 Tax=Recurvomyces mirabilis TaxID=574656 RepID=A0AAE1C6I0_9PEZI|nr:hypothetical protein LTR78_000376 [Recurvomyces mirabilis]KAK5162031.1 hypothetical protein LTS14_000377 [Recurvomyces mirabilis]
MSTNQENLISEEAFLARMNNYTAPDPSPRNPQISTQSSHADRIEANYQADGHKTWGFVIYRTTYDNDTDWTEFMRRLRAWTAENMDFYHGDDVLQRMTWTVFDDRAQFDGVDAAAVRRHFRTWAEDAVRSEQADASDATPVSMGRSPRYRYCIQIDAASLKSAVHDAPAPPAYDQERQGWVKVIGITEHDVGWMKCPFPSVMTEYYMLFNDLNGYRTAYRRPPAVVGYPWN